jgi:hypothetical protein
MLHNQHNQQDQTDFITLPDEHPKLTQYKSLLSYLRLLGSETITETELLDLYNNLTTTITIGEYTIHCPFDAVLYNSLVSLVETLIKEF